MQILILGAGYATRLYPLTENQPKPLLPVAGKPMLEHVLEKLLLIPDIERVCVVTNNKFTPHFETWSKSYNAKFPVTTLNDGTTTNENRLGAIGDTHLFITKENVESDLIVIAGDNLFSKSLEGFAVFAKEKNAPTIGVYDMKTHDAVRNKFGCVSVDAEGKVSDFEEKPADPKSTLIGVGLYYYPANSLPLIKQYVKEGNNSDQPGRLIQWLYPKTPIYTWTVPGVWYDIGSHEALAEANQNFGKS